MILHDTLISEFYSKVKDSDVLWLLRYRRSRYTVQLSEAFYRFHEIFICRNDEVSVLHLCKEDDGIFFFSNLISALTRFEPFLLLDFFFFYDQNQARAVYIPKLPSETHFLHRN